MASSNNNSPEEAIRFKFLKWVGTIFFGILGSTVALSGLGLLAGGIALAFGNPLNILWPLLNILAPVLTSFWLMFGGFIVAALIAVGLFLIARKIYKTLKPPVAKEKPLLKEEEEIDNNNEKKDKIINQKNKEENKIKINIEENKEVKGENKSEKESNNDINNNINETLNINEKGNEIKNINNNINENEIKIKNEDEIKDNLNKEGNNSNSDINNEKEINNNINIEENKEIIEEKKEGEAENKNEEMKNKNLDYKKMADDFIDAVISKIINNGGKEKKDDINNEKEINNNSDNLNNKYENDKIKIIENKIDNDKKGKENSDEIKQNYELKKKYVQPPVVAHDAPKPKRTFEETNAGWKSREKGNYVYDIDDDDTLSAAADLFRLENTEILGSIMSKEAIEQAMEEIEVETQIKEIIRKGEYRPYVPKHYYQSTNRQTSKTNTQTHLKEIIRKGEYRPYVPKHYYQSTNIQTSKTKTKTPRFPLSLNSHRWYPKNQRLNINAREYIPTKNRRKDKDEVTALTVCEPNVIDVKEQTSTSISNNIYDPTGLMYNFVNIIWQTLHKDILTSEQHLKAPMGLNIGKLPSIQIWNNEDISTRPLTNKLENANCNHSIVQIVPMAIMSGKYETGTSKVYFQICIDPTSRSFSLFSLIASLTDKNIPTLSWKVSKIMYDSEKSFTSLSDTILKLPATSNVSGYDAKNGNVVNVIKNSLTHENKEMISNQIAIDKVKDGFQLCVNPIRSFFDFISRNITNIQLNTSDIKLTKKTILQLSNNLENINSLKPVISEKSNENDIAPKDIAIKMSDNVNKAHNKEENNNEINYNLNINEIINNNINKENIEEGKSEQKKQMDDHKSKEKENNIEIKKEEENPVEKEEIVNKSDVKLNIYQTSDENSLSQQSSMITTTDPKTEAKAKIQNQQKEQTQNFLISYGKALFGGKELKETKKRKEEMPYSEGGDDINCILF